MKANFKIKNDDSDKKETDKEKKKAYREYLDSLPEGWNLWSLRATEKQNND